MKKGDFTNLAGDYTRYRPSYNKDIVKIILETVGKNISALKVADIGAGTGIFTKCLIEAGVKDVIAVEPNEDMRKAGVDFCESQIKFSNGSAEKTGLQRNCYDLITMASSFHWPNTSEALKEFDRILTTDGAFSAIWNPRLTDRSESEREVERLLSVKYNIVSRTSSGLSGITSDLREILETCGVFQSVVYAEAVDVVQRSHEEYIGAWRSVNDIQSQLGKTKFSEFIDDVANIIRQYPTVEVHYLTRAWIACKEKIAMDTTHY